MDISKKDFSDLNRLGTLIRQHRIRVNLTQKTLAEKCDLNESTIRNYELGNRCPDEETLWKIANALGISYYALADPNPHNAFGALHVLYDLEWRYGLVPKVVGEEIHLVIEQRSEYAAPVNEKDVANFKTLIHNWNFVREKLNSGEICIRQYFEWESEYPGHVSPSFLQNYLAFTGKDELELVSEYSEENNPFSNENY